MPTADVFPRRPRRMQRRFFVALAAFLILWTALLGAIMLTNQAAVMQRRLQRETADLTRALDDKGETASNFLARIAPQGLLAYDYLLLEGYVEELSTDPDIVYAVIFDRTGKPLTHHLNTEEAYFAGSVIAPSTFSAVLEQARRDATLLHVRRDINHGGVHLGSVEVALSRAKIAHRAQDLRAHLRSELARMALIIVGLLLLSLVALIVLIEWTFRRLVVRPIHALATSMSRLQRGDLNARAAVLSDDEIGYLAQRFNSMADDLREQLGKIAEHARAMQATRDYLAGILDNSADMIATTALDGTVVEFNAAAERILGYPRATVVGRSSDPLYCEPELRDALYGTVHLGRPVQGVETQLLRSDGSRVEVELTLSPLRDAQGELLGALCIGRDITHANVLRRELIQAEKLASIGQVAAWITHQIRNYLGRMLMSAGALRPEPAADACRQQAYEDLNGGIADLGRLVSDLLDYSRTLTLHTTRVDINAVLDDLLRQLATEPAVANIRVARDFAANLPPLSVDVFKLEQALTNVLRNAVQAMPDGGELSVATCLEDGSDTVIVSISDSGRGLEEGDAALIFRPFYTTKASGTGLGLALAERIVQAHGGTIRARKSTSGGAAFDIRLPSRV